LSVGDPGVTTNVCGGRWDSGSSGRRDNEGGTDNFRLGIRAKRDCQSNDHQKKTQWTYADDTEAVSVALMLLEDALAEAAVKQAASSLLAMVIYKISRLESKAVEKLGNNEVPRWYKPHSLQRL
jgi:hypothetical protein